MLARCYGSHDMAYYGKVTVSERWKTFEYFYSDIKKIDGWNQQEFEQGKIVLDKDLKQRHQQEKIYSTDTCAWVSPALNSRIQDGQQRQFKAISPDGDVYYDYNITNFGRKHNLERRQISSTLHKRFETTQGWKFLYIDEEIV